MFRSLFIVSFVGVFFGAVNAIPTPQPFVGKFNGHVGPLELLSNRREKQYGEIPNLRQYFEYMNRRETMDISRSAKDRDTLGCGKMVTLAPGDEVPFALPFSQDAGPCRFAAMASNGSTLSLECPFFNSVSCDSEYLFVGDGDKYNKLYCNGNQPEPLEGVEKLFIQYGRREKSLTEKIGAFCVIRSQGCGKSAINLGIQRIFGGEVAEVGEFPWMVKLTVFTHVGNNFSCGGTILNTRNILTAAHCVVPSSNVAYISVTAGVVRLADEDDLQTIKTQKWTVHKRYSAQGLSYDIAILHLSKDLHFTKLVQPICLAPPRNYESELATASGWGKTEYAFSSKDLLKVGVKVTNHDSCERAYSDYGMDVTENQLCAALPGKDSCQGDSGGPLSLMLGTRWYEIGIVSFGIDCARPLFPGVYTSVSAYNQWIRESIRGGLC